MLAWSACAPETEVHPVRARVAEVPDDGLHLVLDHEAIPGFMEAMRMSLPLRDPAEAEGLAVGDVVRCEIFVANGRASIGAIDPLPADTPLELAVPH